MKKIIPFFILLTFCCKLASAQFTNLNWKVGVKCGIDFKSGTAVVSITDSCKSSMVFANTSISDRNGNIIFYSNACRVYDRNGHVMPNGSGFNQGTYSNNYVNTDYYPLVKSATIVPFPKDSNKFYMFYLNMEWNVDGGYNPDKLYYLVVDKSLNGGLGDVTVKDQIALSGDTLGSNFFSIKHSNGKDWLLVVRKYKGNRYYKVLVDSGGVHSPTTQIVGKDFNYPFASEGAANISAQGNKISYLHETNNGQYLQLDLFDFDRCNGLLSVNQTIFHPNVTGDSIGWGSCCFSPNGRFLYLTDGVKIYQMDLMAANLLNSVQVVGINSINYRAFFKMEIAPDCKIYVAPYGSYNFMSVINNPDNLGTACNFVENAIQFGATIAAGPWAEGGLPNVPNFNLGKLNCDVGIQTTAENKSELLIYPNPSKDKLLVSSNQFTVNTIEVTDLLGQIVLAVAPSPLVVNPDSIGERAGVRSINIENLPSGIYFIRAIDEKGLQQVSKFVKE